MNDVPSERTPPVAGGSDLVLHPLPRAVARPAPPSPTPPARGGRPVCLLAAPRGELGLSRTLVRTLQEELPGIHFTLAAEEPVHLVWLCGTSADAPERVRSLRARHPAATLIVTGRDLPGAEEDELVAAGANVVLGWPVPVTRLREVLEERARA